MEKGYESDGNSLHIARQAIQVMHMSEWPFKPESDQIKYGRLVYVPREVG